MLRVKPFVLYAVTLALIVLSWIFYKFPHGDEYLVLFVLPLVFVLAPFVARLKGIAVMMAATLALLVFYCYSRALNPVDVVVITLMLLIVTGSAYLLRYYHRISIEYCDTDILKRQRKYNSMINELESIDRRGAKIENELGRISRLYEITKRLAPALKFEEMLDALFNFIEDNFNFEHIHLLTFQDHEMTRSTSKSAGDDKYFQDEKNILDYSALAGHVKEREYKPFFMAREEAEELFGKLRIRSGTFMAFPLFLGSRLLALLAIEGASKSSYGRFRILISQIALEFRKVELYEEVETLSVIDGLTGVYLRRYLMERFNEELDRARRLGLTFSIAMVDVDHFKNCNDKHGHLVGDAVLKKIADRLNRSVREVDMICRYGGEEFCIMLPETSKSLAVSVAQRLRRSVEVKTIKAFDIGMKMTVSVGVSTYPEDGDTMELLIEKADTALYKAKKRGRNEVCTP
ncbi:MAG: GGDEF domain-containing protein [Candidatus Omnitrophica bacterium]|nr:GGDEF domain-containing protein [Candidatus Omnitrophota bacterium]